MKKTGIILLTLIVGFSLFSQSHAINFTIQANENYMEALKNALSVAGTNGEDDTIDIRPGTYAINETLVFKRQDNKSIIIQGAGKNETLLDGGGRVQIMVLKTSSGSDDNGTETIVRGMTFDNGYSAYGHDSPDFDYTKGGGGGLFISANFSKIKVLAVKFFRNKTETLKEPAESKWAHLDYGGGGLYIAAGTGGATDRTVEISHCDFAENESTNGGGLHFIGTASLRHCTFFNNKVKINGGGLFAGGSVGITIENSIFKGNQSDLEVHDQDSEKLGGGAITIIPYETGYANIINCRIENNHSKSKGGGVLFYEIGGLLSRNSFTNNRAVDDGGGVWAQGDIRTYNNIIDNNQSGANGGGVWQQSQMPLSINNTIIRNRAEQNGGALYVSAQQATKIFNNIIWENRVGTNGKGKDLHHSTYGNVNNIETHIHNNIIDIQNGAVIYEEGGVTIKDNLYENPKVLMDDGSYKLEEGSRCIDSGTPEALDKDTWHKYEKDETTFTDFYGNNRVANHRIDRGAVEFNAENINTPPVANHQTISLAEDTLNHAILLTGTDPDDDPLTYAVTGRPANGIWSGNLPDLRYTPRPDYHGEDSITFTVNDGRETATGKITITITPVEDPPVATDRSVSIRVDSKEAPIDCSGWDADGDKLTYKISKAPAYGRLTEDKAPVYSYTPVEGFKGSDEFEFTVDDGHGTPAKGRITITVTNTEVAGHPKAGDMEVTVTKNSRDNPIACKGSDEDNAPLAYTISSSPSHGTLDVAKIPNLRYTPDPDFTGTDTFTYTVTDDDNNSATGTVTITVQDETAGADGGGGGGGGGGCFIQRLIQR